MENQSLSRPTTRPTPTSRSTSTSTSTAAVTAPAVARWRTRFAVPARLRSGWDILAGLAVFIGYLAVAGSVARRLPAADAHGRWLSDAERRLRLPAEHSINVWAAGHPALAEIANYHYAVGYLVTTFGVVFWLRLRRRSTYPKQIAEFLAINVVAIVGFAVYPTTPPRLLAGAGYVDTVERHGTWGSWGSGLITTIANQHAAMPSLHVAWASWVAVVLIRERVPGWLRRVAVLHVGTTTAVIVMTGNHWILDAVAGVLLVGTVELARFGLERLAPAVRRRARADPECGHPECGRSACRRPAAERSTAEQAARGRRAADPVSPPVAGRR